MATPRPQFAPLLVVWMATAVACLLLLFPLAASLRAGPPWAVAGVLVALLIGGSLIRAAIDLTRDIVAGRYAEPRDEL